MRGKAVDGADDGLIHVFKRYPCAAFYLAIRGLVGIAEVGDKTFHLLLRPIIIPIDNRDDLFQFRHEPYLHIARRLFGKGHGNNPADGTLLRLKPPVRQHQVQNSIHQYRGLTGSGAGRYNDVSLQFGYGKPSYAVINGFWHGFVFCPFVSKE